MNPSKKSKNTKKNDSLMRVFPPEVITEILTYMPLKSLMRFQLVCKQWRTIVNEHYFMEKHMDSYTVSHYWHQTTPGTDNTRSDRARVAYIHGIDGLVLMRNNDTTKYFVWNPATRKVLELPDPHKDSYGLALSYVQASNMYKMVSIYKDKESGTKCCQVFTLGHSDTWMRLTFPDNVSIHWQKVGIKVEIIPSRGVVHFLLCVNGTFEEIVSLDVESELFVVNYMPKSWTNVCYALDWDGKLVFACKNGENLEVMKLEDWKKHRWCGEKKIIHLPLMKDKCIAVPLLAKKSDIWFSKKDGSVVRYNMESGERFDGHGSSVANKNYPYKPSLVTFEGMQPEDPNMQLLRPHCICDTPTRQLDLPATPLPRHSTRMKRMPARLSDYICD